MRELVTALVRSSPAQLELRLFEVGGNPRCVPAEARGLEDWSGRRMDLRLPRRALGLLSRVGLSADRLLGGVDLFHRVHADWPLVGTGARQVLAVSELPRHTGPHRELVRRGTHALVFAESARRPVAEALELEPERVHAVPVGCDHAGWADLAPRDTPRDGPGRLLVLGAARSSRRPLAVLRAFEVLAERVRDVNLDLCGAEGDAANELRTALAASPVRDRFTWHPPEEALVPRLLAEADVLVHFSEGELTAVTPLEAFHYGAAVVAERLPVFEEDLGGLASLVDGVATDPFAIAGELEGALESARDSAARNRRRARAADFTWRRNADATVEVWRRVLAGAAR